MTPNRSFWRGKSVLITGHTGFKGSWLCLCLDALGAHVHGISLAPPTIPNLYEMAEVGKHIAAVEGDVRDFGTLHTMIKEAQPEIIFHLAAQSLVRRSYLQPLETYATNVMGTVNILEAVRTSQLECSVIIVTSDKCYENNGSQRRYSEGDRLGGSDPYSSSKACAEMVASAYRGSYFSDAGSKGLKVSLASARSGNVIGGGDWAADRLLPDCVRALLAGDAIRVRNPDAIRPWQHVLDPLGGYMLLAERLSNEPTRFSRAWNFGPDPVEGWPVGAVVGKVIELWGSPAQLERDTGSHPHEAPRLELDSTLAYEHLDWRPSMHLEAALELTVDWYRRVANGDSANVVTVTQIEQFLNY